MFGQNGDTAAKRIGEKAQYLKNSWRNARKLKLREEKQSGSGIRADDHASMLNAFLELKCPLFWGLDEIWGTRQDVSPALVLKSTSTQIQDDDDYGSVQPTDQPLNDKVEVSPPVDSGDDRDFDIDSEWVDSSLVAGRVSPLSAKDSEIPQKRAS